MIDSFLALRPNGHEHTTDHENILGHPGHRSRRVRDPADRRVSFGGEISRRGTGRRLAHLYSTRRVADHCNFVLPQRLAVEAADLYDFPGVAFDPDRSRAAL